MTIPTQPVVRFSPGAWKITADGKLRLGCCPCVVCACCFHDNEGEFTHCSEMTREDCVAAGGTSFGTWACLNCFEAVAAGLCHEGDPPLPCGSCENDPMPSIVTVAGIQCDGCSIDCSGEPPSSYCWWKSAEKQFMADHLSGSHVLSRTDPCKYTKAWVVDFSHSGLPSPRPCTFRVTVSFLGDGDQWIGKLNISATTSFTWARSYSGNSAGQPCAPFTAYSNPEWDSCAEFIEATESHTFLCYPNPTISW